MNLPEAVPTNLVNAQAVPAGRNTYVWNGRDSTGNIVPHSVYVYVIKAQDTNNRQGLFDSPYVPGRASVTGASATPTDYNPYSNEPVYIVYILSAPAWVTIEDKLPSNFPGFLLEAAPRDAGPNTEI